MKWFYKLTVVLMIIALILVAGCSNNEKAMVNAVKNGDLAKVQSLLDQGVNPNLQTDDGKTLLMLAAYLGQTDIAKLLIERGADVNAKDKDGKTALMYAAEKGNIEMARLLLENGAELNAVDNNGKTALQIAQENQQAAMVDFLSSWGKPIPAPAPTPAETKISSPAPAPVPVISAITPNRGFNNGSVLVGIEGSNFTGGLQIKLANAESEIPGTNVKVESAAKVTCFFDLTGKTAGQYQVVLTNPDGQTASFEDGFRVETFVPSQSNRILKPIFFDFDKWAIRADQTANLDDNLALLKENPKLQVILGGHADERGPRQYNLELTAKRAKTVKDYLVANGIEAERIIIYAYGKDHPAKSGHDETAWQYNRRVDTLEWETILTKEQVIDETIK